MKKIYITWQRKRLDNGHNDSRYTLSYFIENAVPEFIQQRFPEHEIKDYKTEYAMDIQEVYDDTNGFAVIEFDESLRDETEFMIAIKKLVDFMGVVKRTKTFAIKALRKRFTEVQPDVFEISPEIVDEIDGIIPARYIYL